MAKKTKKPYQKPDFKSEKVIETAALACGKCFMSGPVYQQVCQAKKRLS
ncbi:MAG: hypothetical protein JW803_02680 [Endomicrobiales bacterium]|nr:hypothetical protein [Endomicrobiales bacterium]